jgi:hypothetical protein
MSIAPVAPACRLPGSRPTASTARARSRGRRGAPARAIMCAAPTPPAGSTPGAPGPRLPEPRPGSPARLIPAPGAVPRRGPAARASGCSTGPVWMGLSGTGRSRSRRIQRDPVRPLDHRPADPPRHYQWRTGLFRHLAPRRHDDCAAGQCRGTALGHRGRPRDSQKLETAKNELGLDHNGTRSWHGGHRRVSLVMLALVVLALAMLALAMLAAIRRAANTLAPPESTPRMIRGTHR